NYIYTLSLHDALPISGTSINEHSANGLEITLPEDFLFIVNDGNTIRYIGKVCHECECLKKAQTDQSSNGCDPAYGQGGFYCDHEDRKSTRLNSSHVKI